MNPEEALRMDDAEFRELVITDIRNPDIVNRVNSPEGQALRSLDVVPRWYNTLNIVSRSTEGLLAARASLHSANKYRHLRQFGKNSWLTEAEEYERKRTKTLRFLSASKERISEAKVLYEQIRPREQLLEEERNRYVVSLTRLLQAVKNHQIVVTQGEDEDMDQADEVLWSVLQEVQKDIA